MSSPITRSAASSLPTGTVTFLFSDIEGSTRLVTALGAGFGPLLERHHGLLRAAFAASGGVEVSTEGDAFFVVFKSAPAAIAAAAAAQRALAAEPWPPEAGAVRVRMGVHTGEATLGGDNYVGLDVNRAARIAAAAHGGQVLVSSTTRALVERSLPPDLELRDLGEFRLKDLDRPERLAQLAGTGLSDDFPPPRTLETPSNLPPQVTSFVGRNPEIGEVTELLRGSRLVTLTGPGGTGKTRLSLQVAERLRATFPGGTFFVDLASITDPALMAPSIAHSIGVREDPKRPILESLEDHLRDLHVLLVLDNLEQLRGGATVVARLLAAAPHLTVLATSRETLQLRGEQEYPVPPLAVPDPKALTSAASLSQYDAVALFIQRARAVRPDFSVTNDNAPAVAGICARLDGLPLAIELAAARSKLFAPEAILARLERSLAFLTSTARDLPERQRTLRGAIDWSHDLLDATEQTLFRRLAIFVGGFTIDAAAAVCDPDGELGIDMLDALAAFVDKSLLRGVEAGHGEPRFRMLETIREYAIERLAESDDAELTRRRHEDEFAELARRAEPELLGSSQKDWLDRLEGETDNLRAALGRAADDGRIELALDMGAAMWRFWQQRGHLAEGRAALEGLLGRPAAAGRTAARARALGALGGLIYWQGDVAGAGPFYAESIGIERGLDDPAGLADALYNAGFVAVLTGDVVAGQADYEEAMGIFEAIGDHKGVIRVREGLALLMLHRGDFSAARALQSENLAAFRGSGVQFRVANALSLLGAINMMDGAFEASHACFSEAFAAFRETGDVQAVVRVVMLSAALANAEGDPRRSARLMGAADALKAPLGEIGTPVQMLHLEDPALAARRGLGDDAFEAAYQEGRTLSLDEILPLVQAGTAGAQH